MRAKSRAHAHVGVDLTPAKKAGTYVSDFIAMTGEVPPGYAECPKCGNYVALLKDGKRVRGHKVDRTTPCLGSRQEADEKYHVVFERVVEGVTAVPCKTCGAAVGERCVTLRSGAESLNTFHTGRAIEFLRAGRPAVLVEGVERQALTKTAHREVRAAIAAKRNKVDIKNTPCPECRVESGSCKDEQGKDRAYHLSRKRMAVRRHNEERGL